MKLYLVCLIVAGCAPDVTIDPGQGVGELPPVDGPTTEFDPAASIIPFPNQLLIDPSTGKVNLPAPQCDESQAQYALRQQVLNKLDGFGTYESALQVTFTSPVEADSLAGRVHLFQIDPPAPAEIPVVAFPGTTQRSSADCVTTTPVANVTIVPTVPLKPSATFVVALTNGVTDTSGEPFLPSVTWSLVRQKVDPVTVENGVIVSERTPFDPVTDRERLLGLDLLWKAHAQAMQFLANALKVAPEHVLIAWVMHTQTTTRPLDASITGTIAQRLPKAPLSGVTSLTGGNTEAYLEQILGSACAQVKCEKVGDVVHGTLTVPSYQSQLPNPLAGGDPVPGPWSDPIAPAKTATDHLDVLAFVPAGQPPAGGFPVVVFGHGLTRSSADLYAIGSQLAAAGMASVAINWVDHGSRAVQISDSAAIGCDNSPDPSAAPQCYAPIVSSDLATTRDNVRESVLDALGLINALDACGTTSCGALKVNGDDIGYLGQSLGSFIGTEVVAMSPKVRAAVLNVGGVGWVDTVENTDSAGIRCPLVDALIAAGVIQGVPSTPPPTPKNATCLSDSWKKQPAYQQFAAIARWVLDPADGANYVAHFGNRPVLIQEVVGDQVVPNVATANLAKLQGLTTTAADAATAPGTPSAAITTNPTQPKWVQYSTLPADAGTGFPGNTYAHGSLLAPASSGADGALATAQMQADAITYLVQNLGVTD